MKNILKITLILAGALMITSCEEDAIVTGVDQFVDRQSSFATADYYVVNNPNSLGAIFVNDAAQWKVGDKIRVTGSIKFKRSDEAVYLTTDYTSNGEIKYVTEDAIYIGQDYSGIGNGAVNARPTHIESNVGVIELLRTLPRNGR